MQDAAETAHLLQRHSCGKNCAGNEVAGDYVVDTVRMVAAKAHHACVCNHLCDWQSSGQVVLLTLCCPCYFSHAADRAMHSPDAYPRLAAMMPPVLPK